jgi:hypothetical protein
MSPPNRPEPVVDVAKRILSARDTEIAPYAQLYPLLLGEMDEIMAEWDRNTDELPWSALEEADRQNNLAGVITRVIDCAMSDASREERVEVARRAPGVLQCDFRHRRAPLDCVEGHGTGLP